MDCIVLDSLDPYFNQACEETLFLHRKGDLLLLWRNAPAVICGKYQNLYAEVSLPAARAQNIAVLRRETGGGTVYHDEGNLNYAFFCDRDGKSGYEPFLTPVIAALRSLGVPAEPGRICDLTAGGVKISGNAQKVTADRIWHHGTLLFSADLTRLKSVASGARADYRSKGVPSSPFPVGNLAPLLPGMTVLSFRDALREALGGRTVSLTEEETCEAQRLAREKYRAWDWTFGTNPAFTLTRQTPFGTMTLESRRGTITGLDLAPELVGCRLDTAEPALAGSKLLPYLF